MNSHEIQKAISDLAAKVGRKAYITFSITNEAGMHCSLYTGGISQARGDVQHFSVFHHGKDAGEILAAIEAKWLAESEKRGARIIEEMALEIIRLTAEFGTCTDAALRAKYGETVAIHSDAATVRANEMAANGPFSVVKLSGANAPAEAAE